MALPVRRRDSAPRPVQRWDPLRELDTLREQVSQLVQSSFTDGDGLAALTPPVDIEETEDAWIVEAELPGVRPEDVNVELRGNELAISGEIKERERQGVLRRRMRRVGEFDFHISLPGEADSESVEAKIHDGILTVRIPKPEQERPRRIEVTPG
jgi:HSP20 family protein